ncbi:MAG: hypothetical protein GX254_03500 [Clostridiales bacterium]|nr:hypothetical protein [Clostridiales bacterium]
MRKLNLHKTRLTAVLLTLVLILGALPLTSEASFIPSHIAADTLNRLGLFKGSDSGYELDRQITKQEAVTMLVRLLGKEQEAVAYTGTECPFSDVEGWAKGYVSVAYNNDLVLGTSESWLGAASLADAKTFITFTLRALGYSEEAGDFTYNNAISFSDSIGLTNGEYRNSSHAFLREDAVLLSYNALITPMKKGDKKLIEHLIELGVIDRENLLDTNLSGYYNYGKTLYSASEIYERASAATFQIKMYKDEESYEEDEPHGFASGFFISPDGLALTCYHSIELKSYGRIITNDGRLYEDIKVVFYDGYRDIAVLRVGKTSVDGRSVRNFPYITLGNSDAIANGHKIYTLSSPGGFQDCISDGMVSTKNRVADDPAYPLIQFTAPISPGSSGGVLLNEHCEAIGVCMGAFNAGNNLNLAVPVNCLSGIDLSGEGKTFSETCQYDTELNNNSTLTITPSSITIGVGEKFEAIVTRDSPGSVGIQFIVGDPEIVDCRWGSFTTKTTVPIYITGKKKGTTTVAVKYYEGTGNPNATAEINVVVE